MNEHLSKKHLISFTTILKVQKKQRCANKYNSHSGSCVKMRRNDIIKRKRGGDGGDDSIWGKKKFKN